MEQKSELLPYAGVNGEYRFYSVQSIQKKKRETKVQLH